MQAALTRFLRNIPQSNQPPLAIDTIAPDEDKSVLLGVALMLKTLGIVKLDENHLIQATSQTAKYMLHSLASYVEAGLPLIDDWHTRGIDRDNSHNPLQNAATFLHMLETRRIEQQDNPTPSRSEEVAQVLIKRTNTHTKQGELLFQFDANANQYQLIGGRRSTKDKDLLATMIREIEEEVANDLVYQKDYNLTCVIKDLVPPVTLSSTFGALTEYHFQVYHMTGLSERVQMQPDDEWVPIDDMLAGYVINGNDVMIPFNTGDIYHLINKSLPGGLASLPDSFRKPEH